MKKTNKKGFTLVELVIVIAVIAILAGVLIATFASVIKRANQSAEVQNIKNAEIAQKADDIIKKIEESNWFGWEDFEAEIVKAVAEAAKSGQLSLDEIKPVVEDAVKTALANIKVENTGLTAEDVKAIVENAMGSLKYEGVTEAQVRAIVNGGTATLLGNQLTAAQVRSIVNTANEQNLTAVQLANVLSSQLSGVATLEALNAKMGDLQTAITGATANLATKEDVQTILDTIENFETTVNSADLDDVITAKALNIRIKNAGLTRANTPYDVVSAIEATDSELKSTILLSISQEQFGFFVIDDSNKLVNSCGLNISVDADNKVENAYKYWAFVSTYKTTDGFDYSQYLLGTGVTGTIDIDTGLDVGKNEGISEINYTSTTGHTVVIRTNGGTLTIDAENDTIKHYGTAQVVTLAAVSVNSYYENGEVKQVNIKKGRLVLTNNEDASVETIYIQATGDTYDNIILATQNGAELPNLITRDNVPLPTGDDTKKVVTIQTNVNEEGNSPEKTETINLYGTQGTSGNDVYEATNGYNVTALALLVVEASSIEAQEQAAQQISDPEVVAQVSESKTAVEVDTEEEMTAALQDKAKYIIVTGSFDTTKAFLIKGSTIIEGRELSNNTYPTITSKATTKAEKRGFRISESNIDVTLRNLTVNVRDSVTSDDGFPRGLQIDSNITGINLFVDNCNISATHYAFNVCNGAEVTVSFVNSKLLGYGALNLWHADYTVKVENSVLEGVQNGREAFAVVVLEGDTTGKTDLHSTSVTVQIDNSEIIATCNDTTGGYEAFIGFNKGATANTVKLNNCDLTSKGAGITKIVYDSGTSNKLYFNDELFDVVKYENELFDQAVQEKRATVAAEIDNAVLYYWINSNGSKAGGYYNIETPFNNGYVMDGEYIVLMEDIVLTANSNGSSSLSSGDSFSFITNDCNVIGGTIKLGVNITAISDSNELTCFVNTDGTVIVAVDNGNGTYSYTGN